VLVTGVVANALAAPVASFGPGKPDGQDKFQLVRFDPTWQAGQGKEQFVAIGEPITLDG